MSELSRAELIGVREAARIVGVHENTIRNWYKRGLIGALPLPGSGFLRFNKAEVERMREEMWSQFAPATTLPTERRIPAGRKALAEEER